MRNKMVSRALWLAIASGAVGGLAGAAVAQERPAENPQPTAPPEGAQPQTPPAPAEGAPLSPAPDAGRAVFEQARDAVRRAQAITYRAKYFGTGGMETYTSTVEADVRLMRSPRGTGWLGRAIGTAQSRSVPRFEIDVGWREITNEWVDHKEKKVFEKNKRESKGVAFTMGNNARLEELIDIQPFKNELAANVEYEVEPPVDFDGAQCDSIIVHTGRTNVRWVIGRQDHLPRKREAILNSSTVSGTMVLELHDIKADETKPPRMTEDMLRVVVPPDYTEDRVAPPPPPPAPPPPVAPPADSGREVPKGESPKGEEPAPKPPEPPQPTVRRVPEFELSTPTGEKVTAASLQGKVAVLEFGGSWCLPLRDAHPELQALTQALKDRGVLVYYVNVREKNPAQMVEELGRAGFTFGVLLNGDQAARAFGVKRYPTYFVVDPAGTIVATEAGFTKDSTLNAVRQAAEAALGSAPAPAAPPPAGSTAKP